MAGKHTAGPWSLARSVRTWQMPLQIEAPDGTCIVAMEPHPLHDMASNACLIAAAPDLLGALERIQHLNGNDYFDGGVCAMRAIAEAAITRATQPLPPPNEEV